MGWFETLAVRALSRSIVDDTLDDQTNKVYLYHTSALNAVNTITDVFPTFGDIESRNEKGNSNK
eukprot:13044591-Ditylum_brightwellii.AAC.1